MYKQSAKALNKIRAFSRIAPNLEYEKNVMLYDSFVLSNFNCCSLIWMFSGNLSNNEINRIHKRAVRVLLHDYGSTFEELLQKRVEHIMHTKNLQTLLLEVYKCLTSKNPSFLFDLFELRPTNHNLRVKDLIQLPSTRTVKYGLNSLRFRRSMLWNTLSDMIKSAKSDRQLMNRIKEWTGSTYCCLIRI